MFFQRTICQVDNQQVRSPLLGACNSHNKLGNTTAFLQNSLFSDIFSREIGQLASTWVHFGKDKTVRPHVNMSTLVRAYDCNWFLRLLKGSEFEIIQTKNRSFCENSLTGKWPSNGRDNFASCFPTEQHPHQAFSLRSEIYINSGQRLTRLVRYLVLILGTKLPTHSISHGLDWEPPSLSSHFFLHYIHLLHS